MEEQGKIIVWEKSEECLKTQVLPTIAPSTKQSTITTDKLVGKWSIV